jgi:hypothetical protein
MKSAECIFWCAYPSHLQDWDMECKDLESRRQIGEFENGNAEE